MLNTKLLKDPNVEVREDRVVVTDLRNKRQYFFTQEDIARNPNFIENLVKTINS